MYFLFGCAALFAQSSGSITGTVLDNSGAVVAGAEVVLRGAVVKSGTATVLTGSVLPAHNTFDHRNEVSPQVKDVASTGNAIHG
jgi:alpha-L-arabinofuranosidase